MPANEIFRTIFGIIFLLLGIAGIFLPIIPGIVFLFIGAGLLGFKSFRRFLDKIKKKVT